MCLRLSAQRCERKEYLSPGSHPCSLSLQGGSGGEGTESKRLAMQVKPGALSPQLYTVVAVATANRKCGAK